MSEEADSQVLTGRNKRKKGRGGRFAMITLTFPSDGEKKGNGGIFSGVVRPLTRRRKRGER